MAIAAVFPGQGSHRAGSLDAWRDHPAFAVTEDISAALGRDIVAIAGDGTAGSRTADAQPAIFTASIVAWQALTDAGVDVDVVAGHSLGEYTAACAGGCFDVSAASRLVGARGAAMAASCAANPGTMAAIVKLDPDALAALVADIPQLVVANDNAHGQAVVAGPHDAVDRVRDRAREAGGRAVPLDVEGAFHSPAMAEAVDKVAAALAALDIADPRVPLVSGASASALRTGTAIGDALVAGMLAPVRWREVQAELAAMGVTELLEVGPGGVLSGLAKRELAGVRVHRIEAPDDVADVVGALADHKCSEVAS